MTVQAPIRIHVMGVSGDRGSADDRRRNKWLEQWWGAHNSQLGLAGDDEASGTNLPCTLTCSRAQECLLPCLSITLLSSFVTVSCVRYSSFIWSSLFVNGDWSAHNTLLPSIIVSSIYSVSLTTDTESWAPVKTAFIYITRIKVCTGAELFPHRSSYQETVEWAQPDTD